jgi:hypothetical protein
MSEAKGVTAEELVRALKRRKAALPAEIGTFVVLETCEVMLSRGPATVRLGNIVISDEGVTRIEEAAGADEVGAARALHGTLTSLLVAAGPAPAPALMRLVEQGPSGGEWSLAQLRDDLEASLVPLNRTASRRVLARLVRETGWHDRPNQRRGPTFRELDAELNSLLGGPEEEPEPPKPAKEPSKRDRDATVREPIEHVDPASDELFFGESLSGPPVVADVSSSTAIQTAFDSALVQMPPSTGGPGQLRGLEGLDSLRPQRSSRGLAMGALFVLLAVGLVAAVLVMRPDVLSKLTGDANASEPPPHSNEPRVVHTQPQGGDLVVHVSPDRAQILRFVGRGPVTVPNLPIGVAHEFVALADGAKATRVVIPPDAEWESTPEGPRFELAMQLAPAANTSSLELGDTQLPQNVGAPKGALGSARIVTTPRGAKVYQVIGFAPEAKVQDLALDKTEELLVYLPGHAHVVRVVSPSDFAEQGGRKVAEVSIELTPIAGKHRK